MDEMVYGVAVPQSRIVVTRHPDGLQLSGGVGELWGRQPWPWWQKVPKRYRIGGKTAGRRTKRRAS